MHIEWMTLLGLVGLTLVISGSNVLPQFRDWCQGFQSPMQPLRWVGVTLEFAGIVTDKSMATGFVLGMIWWAGPRSWPEVFILSGLLSLAAAFADGLLAFMHAGLRKAMGGSGMPSGPIPMPRRRMVDEDGEPIARRPTSKLRSLDRPLTEREAFDALDGDDDEADHDRGTLVRVEGDR